MMAAEVIQGPEFKSAPARSLFRVRIPAPLRTGVQFNYDVAPDGRFLINTVKRDAAPAGIRVIVNWKSP